MLRTFSQSTQPAQTITSNAYGEPILIATAGQGLEQLLWNAQGKLYQDKNSAYSWDAFDQNTLVVTGSGASQTSIVRVGDNFEYDIAGRADKYFSVGGVRIATLATNYIAGAASIPPALRPALRGLEPLAAPLAAGFLLLGLVSLASVATRKRPPVWVSAPGVGVLSLVLVAMPFQAYAATLGSGGPGTFGRPAEPFLAYITDHLGSVRAVVNSSGTVVETRDYDPFGADTSHTGTFSVQHRFTGQPADDQAGGLYNYGARFYNAKWGRFLSPDEVTQGFDSQGLNPYSYVENGPTSATDSTGEFLDGLGGLPSISLPSIGLSASSGSMGGLGGLGTLASIAATHGPRGQYGCDYESCDDPEELSGELGPEAISEIRIPTTPTPPSDLTPTKGVLIAQDYPVPPGFFLYPPGTTVDQIQRERIQYLLNRLDNLRWNKKWVDPWLGPVMDVGTDALTRKLGVFMKLGAKAANEALQKTNEHNTDTEIKEIEAELRSYGFVAP